MRCYLENCHHTFIHSTNRGWSPTYLSCPQHHASLFYNSVDSNIVYCKYCASNSSRIETSLIYSADNNLYILCSYPASYVPLFNKLITFTGEEQCGSRLEQDLCVGGGGHPALPPLPTPHHTWPHIGSIV